MLVLTIKKKQGGERYGMYEVYDPLVSVPMFRIIDIDKYGIYKKKIRYNKGEYVPLWLVGVVAVGGYFGYKKFKK